MKHGHGKFTWPDGSSYEGDFSKDKICGLGILKWADGSQYIGNWLDNNMHGKGKFSQLEPDWNLPEAHSSFTCRSHNSHILPCWLPPHGAWCAVNIPLHWRVSGTLTWGVSNLLRRRSRRDRNFLGLSKIHMRFFFFGCKKQSSTPDSSARSSLKHHEVRLGPPHQHG